MMVFPIFIPSGGGSGSGGGGAGLIALLVSMPLYAFVVFAIGHFFGIDPGWMLGQWWGFPALMAILVSYAGACVGTAAAVDTYFDN